MIELMTDIGTADQVRRPGRPRDARVEAVVLDAVRAVLGEAGFGGLTVDAVAARAGVGKATIYRRWRSREELVRDALAELIEDEETPDTGSLAGDLRQIASHFADDAHGPKGQLMPSLCAEAQTDPDLAAILDSFAEEKRRLVTEVFGRAKRRGELRAGVDPEVCLDMLLGPVVFRRLVTREAIDRRYADKVVETLVAGCVIESHRPRPSARRAT